MDDDPFETPGQGSDSEVPEEDPLRPEAKRGRYRLPNPDTGKPASHGRVTSFVDYFADTYHLDLWKLRCVVVGLAQMFEGHPEKMSELAQLDVKTDKARLDRIAARATELSGAHRVRNEGSALHKSTEHLDAALGDILVTPERHHVKMALYLQTLREARLRVIPDLIERVTLSRAYGVAGKFDRIMTDHAGRHVMVDLKTGDSLEYSMSAIAAQLASYVDGVNNTGIWDGARYDQSIKVREDKALVIHLPSTRDECHVIEIDLAAGREVNEANLAVRNARRIKHANFSRSYLVNSDPAGPDSHWRQMLSQARSRDELIDIVNLAKQDGSFSKDLGDLARSYATALESMGS